MTRNEIKKYICGVCVNDNYTPEPFVIEHGSDAKLPIWLLCHEIVEGPYDAVYQAALEVAYDLGKKKEEQLFHYGVIKTKKGFQCFTVRDGKMLPENMVVHKIASLKPKTALEFAKQELEAFNKNLLEESLAPSAIVENINLFPGVIATHNDGANKTHMSIIIDIIGSKTNAVFFTSASKWHDSSSFRKATQEELAFAGYVQTKNTYIAPVTRLTNDFFIENSPAAPESLVKKLREEFFS